MKELLIEWLQGAVAGWGCLLIYLFAMLLITGGLVILLLQLIG